MSRPLTLPLRRMIAALLLLAASWQALAPGWSPLEPVRGSAFSAATADVALAPARQADPARTAPLPAAPLVGRPESLPLPQQAALRPAAPLRPASTGPPAIPPRLLLPEPRAPPFA